MPVPTPHIAAKAGDIAKTALAFGLCRAIIPALGGLSGLWAGLGAVLGLNFPLWRGFRGGKGVAVTCAASSSSPPCGGRPPVCPDWPSPCSPAGCPWGRW